MPAKIEGKATTIILTYEQQKALERIAKRHNTTKATVLRACLDMGIKLHDAYQKIGFFRLVDVVTKSGRVKVIEREIQPTNF